MAVCSGALSGWQPDASKNKIKAGCINFMSSSIRKT
jgi:hypothetical protein